MKKLQWFLLILILLGGFVVRFYKLSSPIADWHSWRQADTSAVSRNFVLHGIDVLHPTYDDISNVQTGKDNPKGYRFVEFPILNVFQATLFTSFDKLTLEEWGRIVTIIASTLSILFIFLLGRKYGNWVVGISAAFFYAFVPYNIYYGRVILPDPSMVMATLGAIYFFDTWLEITSKNKSSLVARYLLFLLAIIFSASALLFKPFAIFFFLPMAWIAYEHYRLKMFIKPSLWIFAIVSILPLVWWRWWMMHYPEGIPASTWLFNGGNIRFTGAFFYWLFAERISKLILGYWGIVIVMIGFLSSKRKNFGFFLSFAVSSLLYLCIIARGNVQHDYYQILIIPTLALFFGLGVDFLFVHSQVISKKTAIPVLFVCTIFMLAFGWYQVRDYFNINNPSIIAAGQAVDRLTPKNALIVAPYNGDTSLLYQTKRKGWPSFEKSLEDLMQMGASYLVLVNPTKQDYDIGKKYKIIASNNDYIIFDLHQKP